MKKVLSLCIAMAIILGLFSSCANLPGGKPPANETPRAADQPSEENTNAEPDPVDLSGLTEKELGRISEDLMDILKLSNNSDEILICIFFKETEEEKNIDEIVNKQMSQNDEKIKQIESEILELEKEYDIQLETQQIDGTNDITTDKTDSIDATANRISELKTELKKYNIETKELRLQLLREINEPIIKTFSKEHNIDLSSANHVSYTVSSIFGITLSAKKVIELAKDNSVSKIYSLTYPEYDSESYMNGS